MKTFYKYPIIITITILIVFVYIAYVSRQLFPGLMTFTFIEFYLILVCESVLLLILGHVLYNPFCYIIKSLKEEIVTLIKNL